MGKDFSRVTACGEDCSSCRKKLSGKCPGCIEVDGVVPEWKDSGRCRVHACARKNGVQFCGLCEKFPCSDITELISWNPDIIKHMESLREAYLKKGNK